MKILIVSQYFWPENFKINDFAVSLIDRGHDVTVLTGLPNFPNGKIFDGYSYFKSKKQLYQGVKIIRTMLIPRGNGSGLRLFVNYLSFVFFGTLSAIFSIKGSFDIIFVCQLSPVTVAIPAILLKKLKKIPMVLWVLDLWPESVFASSNLRSKQILNSLNFLVKKIYENSDHIFVSSKGFIKSISEKGVDPQSISYMPNWVEDVYFKEGFHNIPEISSSDFKIMFAGAIGEAQDFESIINAAVLLKDYSDIKWIILGDGRKMEWLKNTVTERKLNDFFYILGKYPIETMASFYSAADVMLVSLKKDPIFSLTVPAKVQTYLACKKPILAMIDGEGAQTVIDANAGLTCDSGDYTKLAENILTLYKLDKSGLEQYSQNAFNYYKKYFDKKNIIANIESQMKIICSN